MRVGETVTISSPIDVHVHLRQPGGEHKETIHSGTKAALTGGYQAVFDMPNNPNGNQTWSIGRLEEKEGIARTDSYTDIGFYAGVDLANPDLRQVHMMADRSAGLKLYMGYTTGNAIEHDFDDTVQGVVDAWIRSAEESGVHPPILLHAREEVGATAMDYIARWKEYPVHWCHVATESEVTALEKVRQRARGQVTAGVTPHHLFMTSRNADFQQGWNGARMMPPLGAEADADALLHAYNAGTLNILETDHAPHTQSEKMAAEEANPTNEQATDQDCFGVSGIEFVLPIMMQRVRLGQVTLKRLEESLYDEPLRMLGLSNRVLNGKTDITIRPHVIAEHDIVGNSANTPYINWLGGAVVTGVTRNGISYAPAQFDQLLNTARTLKQEAK